MGGVPPLIPFSAIILGISPLNGSSELTEDRISLKEMGLRERPSSSLGPPLREPNRLKQI